MEMTISLAVQIADDMTESFMIKDNRLKNKCRSFVNGLILSKIDEDFFRKVLLSDSITKGMSDNDILNAIRVNPIMAKFSTSAIFVNGDHRFQYEGTVRYPINPSNPEFEISLEELTSLRSFNNAMALNAEEMICIHSFIISKLLACDTVEDVKELYPEAYPFAMNCLKKRK